MYYYYATWSLQALEKCYDFWPIFGRVKLANWATTSTISSSKVLFRIVRWVNLEHLDTNCSVDWGWFLILCQSRERFVQRTGSWHKVWRLRQVLDTDTNVDDVNKLNIDNQSSSGKFIQLTKLSSSSKLWASSDLLQIFLAGGIVLVVLSYVSLSCPSCVWWLTRNL